MSDSGQLLRDGGNGLLIILQRHRNRVGRHIHRIGGRGGEHRGVVRLQEIAATGVVLFAGCAWPAVRFLALLAAFFNS
eukprot:181074-Prymnesium_polylepis.1